MAVTYRILDDLLKNKKSDVLAPGAQQPTPDEETQGFTGATIDNKSSTGFAGNEGGKKDYNTPAIAKAGAAGALLSKENIAATSSNQVANENKKIEDAQKKLKDYADTFLYGGVGLNKDTAKGGVSKMAEGYTITDDDLAKLMAGDVDAYKKVENNLALSWDPEQMEKFNPDLKSVIELQKLTNPETRAAALQQQNQEKFKGNYSSGQGRLDSALLDAANIDYNPIFEKNIKLEQDAMASEKLAKEMQEAEAYDLGVIQSTAKGKLGTSKKELDDDIKSQFEAAQRKAQKELWTQKNTERVKQEEALDYVGRRAALRDLRASVIDNKAKLDNSNGELSLPAGQPTHAQQLAQIDAQLAKLDTINNRVRADEFLNPGTVSGKADDTITGEQAKRFNILSNILGTPGTAKKAGSGMRVAKPVSNLTEITKATNDVDTFAKNFKVPTLSAKVKAASAGETGKAVIDKIGDVASAPTDWVEEKTGIDVNPVSWVKKWWE